MLHDDSPKTLTDSAIGHSESGVLSTVMRVRGVGGAEEERLPRLRPGLRRRGVEAVGPAGRAEPPQVEDAGADQQRDQGRPVPAGATIRSVIGADSGAGAARGGCGTGPRSGGSCRHGRRPGWRCGVVGLWAGCESEPASRATAQPTYSRSRSQAKSAMCSAAPPGRLADDGGAGVAHHRGQQVGVDLAGAEVGVPVGAGVELVAAVVAVHQVDPAGDLAGRPRRRSPASCRRRARGRCRGRSRPGRSRSVVEIASHTPAIRSR